MDLLLQLQNYVLYIMLGLTIIILILFIFVLVQGAQIRKLKRKYDAFMGPNRIKNVEGNYYSLEELLNDHLLKVETIHNYYEELKNRCNLLENQLKICVQKVGIVRYNPFDNMGGELSYSVAFLDENNDGVVFNSLMGRESCFTYAKPIVKGESEISLSKEEKEAVQKAMVK